MPTLTAIWAISAPPISPDLRRCKKLHTVMVWFTRVVNTRLRLSAYSSRKIAAFNLMSAGGEQGLLVASEMLGHSNPAITRTYLQLGSKASAIQSRLAMEVSV